MLDRKRKRECPGRSRYRRGTAMALLAIVTASLSGCGASVEEYVSRESDQVTLRTVSMSGGANPGAGVYEEIRLEFMMANPGIFIDDESQSSDEQWKTGVVTDFAVGNEPDVLQFFTDATANQLVAMDKFVTIEEIREVYPDYAADTWDWALEQASNADGVARAVPTTGFWEGLYVNEDLFLEYELPLPTDWDSFVQAVKVFRENDIVPVACALSNVPHYWLEYLLLYTAGEESYLEPGGEPPESWVRAVELFGTLREMGAFPEDTDSITNEYAAELFGRKKAAMFLEGNWYLPAMTDTEHTLVLPFPGVPDQKTQPGTIIGGMTSGFYITRRAWNDPEKREAAVRYVMAQTCRAAVQRYYDNVGGAAVAATEVIPPRNRSRLAECAAKYEDTAVKKVLPTDSRMDPQAYKELIAGIPEISLGSPADKLLRRVFELAEEKGIQYVQGNDH